MKKSKKKSRVKTRKKVRKKVTKKEKKSKVMNILSENYEVYKKSFRKLKNTDSLLLLGYEILFVLLIIFGNFLSTKLLESQKIFLFGIDTGLLALVSVIIILISALYIAVSFSLSRGLSWNLLLEKKFNLQYLYKFTILNIVWFICWGIVILISGYVYSKSLRDPTAPVIWFNIAFLSTWLLILLCFHFTMALHYSFTKQNKPLKAAMNSWRIGKNIHLFLIPYAFIVLTLVIVKIITSVFGILPLMLQSVLYTVLFFIFLVWFRYYIADIEKYVEGKL